MNIGTFPLFFTPKAVGTAIARLWKTVLSAQAIVQKAYPLADKLGENIFDRHFTRFNSISSIMNW